MDTISFRFEIVAFITQFHDPRHGCLPPSRCMSRSTFRAPALDLAAAMAAQHRYAH